MKLTLLLVYSKLAWMNMGYKNKYASPLADLLAFRKVVFFSSDLIFLLIKKEKKIFPQKELSSYLYVILWISTQK